MTLFSAPASVPERTEAAHRASKSSFYAGMRILPRAQREAMYEVYSFCRAVDDLADDPGPRAQRFEQLQHWRRDIDALYASGASPPLRALQEAVSHFSLRREDFHAVIDGMEMDVNADIVAPDWAAFDLYCDRVASAVGRLSVRIFGMEETAGLALAHHLGRALQITNILRDIDEDAQIGRLYLPREALERAGIPLASGLQQIIAHPALGLVCAELAREARAHFDEADAIMAAAPRAQVRTPRILGETYRTLLDDLVTRGWQHRPRVRVRRSKLIWLIVRHGII